MMIGCFGCLPWCCWVAREYRKVGKMCVYSTHRDNADVALVVGFQFFVFEYLQ